MVTPLLQAASVLCICVMFVQYLPLWHCLMCWQMLEGFLLVAWKEPKAREVWSGGTLPWHFTLYRAWSPNTVTPTFINVQNYSNIKTYFWKATWVKRSRFKSLEKQLCESKEAFWHFTSLTSFYNQPGLAMLTLRVPSWPSATQNFTTQCHVRLPYHLTERHIVTHWKSMLIW